MKLLSLWRGMCYLFWEKSIFTVNTDTIKRIIGWVWYELFRLCFKFGEAKCCKEQKSFQTQTGESLELTFIKMTKFSWKRSENTGGCTLSYRPGCFWGQVGVKRLCVNSCWKSLTCACNEKSLLVELGTMLEKEEGGTGKSFSFVHIRKYLST